MKINRKICNLFNKQFLKIKLNNFNFTFKMEGNKKCKLTFNFKNSYRKFDRKIQQRKIRKCNEKKILRYSKF